MKPKKPDSPPRTKAKAVKAVLSTPRPAGKSRKKAPSPAAAGPARAARPSGVESEKSAAVFELKMPPILLEGDEAAPGPAGGPDRRYVLGPTPPVHSASASTALPESYGTQQLFLAARDPRWLYAHWDFTAAQLKEYNALSNDGHLLLRLYRDAPAGPPLSEVHLHPESRHWFVPAPHAGAKYTATLGYFDPAKKWVELACSAATVTPPDSVAEDTAVRFATIPPDVPFAQLLAFVEAAAHEDVPLSEALSQLRAEGFSGLPGAEQIPGPWTPAQEATLAAIVMLDDARRICIGSLEVSELSRRELEKGVSAINPARPGEAPGGVSSPSGQPERRRNFWLNVNAELVVYGSTQPDATLTIGGRQIELRRDGSFSCRFALPDGSYELAVAARPADGVETRQADLFFSRISLYEGEVKTVPRDETLPTPPAGAVT
jgi:hypothetical protein